MTAAAPEPPVRVVQEAEPEKPKVSGPRTCADIESEIRAATHLRDLGRLRGEVRPLPRVVDDLLEEWRMVAFKEMTS